MTSLLTSRMTSSAPRRRAVTPPGHPRQTWDGALRHRPALRLPARMAGRRVLVAAAHADDETLGAGGILQAMAARGAQVRVLIATDGASAFPDLGADRRAKLARTRQQEAHSALKVLGVCTGDVHFLEVPDGAARDHQPQIARAIVDLGGSCDWWVMPWRHDPHPDHQAVGRAAAGAHPPGLRLLEYPIWMRHSMSPRDPRVPYPALRVLRLTRGQYVRKQRAIAAHASQVRMWDDACEPVLPGHVLSLFRSRAEPFFVTDASSPPSSARQKDSAR